MRKIFFEQFTHAFYLKNMSVSQMRVLLSCKIVLMLIGILKISKIEKFMKFSSFCVVL